MKIILAAISLTGILLITALTPGLKGSQLKSSTVQLSDTSKKKNNKAFDYPDEVTSDTARKRFEKDFKKGKILYEINCAKCHNVKENNKPAIPDFSLPQLMDYEMRFQYPDHEEDLKETNITHEELEFVVQYLRYKKRSGITYKILPQKK